MLFRFITVASASVAFLTFQAINSEATKSIPQPLTENGTLFTEDDLSDKRQIGLLDKRQFEETIVPEEAASSIPLPKEAVDKNLHSAKKKATDTEPAEKPVIYHTYLPPKFRYGNEPQNYEKAPRKRLRSRNVSVKRNKKFKQKSIFKQKTRRKKLRRQAALVRYKRRKAARRRAFRRYYRRYYRRRYGYY